MEVILWKTKTDPSNAGVRKGKVGGKSGPQAGFRLAC